jgi:hypothetical protein
MYDLRVSWGDYEESRLPGCEAVRQLFGADDLEERITPLFKVTSYF